MKRWKVTKAGVFHKCEDGWKIYFARDPEKWYINTKSIVLSCNHKYIKPPAKIKQAIRLIDFEYKMKGYSK